jgi:GNAT superfamily N-acetyltransferase
MKGDALGILVRQIDVDETLELRQRVLRPGQSPRDLVFPGDRDSSSFHAGAFEGGENGGPLVGVASVYEQAMEGAEANGLGFLSGAGVWRLRGMAVDDGCRGKGIGGVLLRACVEWVEHGGGRVLWCNARVPAEAFYVAHGFVRHGDVFELPAIGPHVVMSRALR